MPFALLVSVGSAFAPGRAVVDIPAAPPPALAVLLEEITTPFDENTGGVIQAAPPARDLNWTPVILIAVWLAGSVEILLLRFRSWRRIRQAVRTSTPLDVDGVRSNGAIPFRAVARGGDRGEGSKGYTERAEHPRRSCSSQRYRRRSAAGHKKTFGDSAGGTGGVCHRSMPHSRLQPVLSAGVSPHAWAA